MQTITINVPDSHLDNVLALLNDFQEGLIDNYTIVSQEDSNLALDPYYTQRKERLTQLRQDIRSNKVPMYDFETSMDELIRELEA